MSTYDVDQQVEEYYGTFAGEPANEDSYEPERGREPKDPSDFWPVDYVINDAVAAKMYNALMVLTLDANIHAFLSLKDPKALQQGLDAIEDYKSSYQESTTDNL